ncbi:MAG: hypothetical protein DRP71_12765 [Verrucomicrobia bacterium]|nr:MAG: hypothetical protein DRP71_12765 [Verrucomicrobiota bacterium]
MTTLSDMGWEMIERRIEGIHEKYIRIRIRVRRPEVNLYIYEDEAGIQGDGIDIRLERPDHRNPDELIAAFIGSLHELEAQQNSRGP